MAKITKQENLDQIFDDVCGLYNILLEQRKLPAKERHHFNCTCALYGLRFNKKQNIEMYRNAIAFVNFVEV